VYVMKAYAARNTTEATEWPVKWYEWGEPFCLEPEEVSCLWHWPRGSWTGMGPRQGRPALLRGPQEKATTVRHDVQGLMGSDCMRWLEGLVRLGPNCLLANHEQKSATTDMPSKPALERYRKVMTTSRRGQAPIVALAGAEYVRIWTSAAIVA
jgi:hypothetical protein